MDYDFNYNTSRPHLEIREYGRNIQLMIDYTKTIEDREERNKAANTIVHIMGYLNPHLRDINDFKHKLWDHLFMISNFELDVDSPYPKPNPEELMAKGDRLDYPQQKIKAKHYGKVVEKMIEAAIELEESPEKEYLVEGIANFMKMSYKNWNNNILNDEEIMIDLKKLSDGKLILDIENTQLRYVSPDSPNKNHRHKNYRNKNNNNKYRNRKR